MTMGVITIRADDRLPKARPTCADKGRDPGMPVPAVRTCDRQGVVTELDSLIRRFGHGNCLPSTFELSHSSPSGGKYPCGSAHKHLSDKAADPLQSASLMNPRRWPRMCSASVTSSREV